ncbi:type II toxin-antitoxin system RelB/DinJ family antitoxin [uncultured Sneathia sp.]|uniref:type II toxin-antitoxin system RelB/DinJ family antitoxin n=1 Tax=Sneathia vaginalis TaxID=187101 RepID=UPI00259A57AA|nr:type II toxin-antitoxin system RelB/DinJ family antitoxin [uncultured Sneathia sp.]MBE2989088.1 type II toxin-antitoxin system RelB/DinJ family antitoxin [Sneathia sp. DSM 16630]
MALAKTANVNVRIQENIKKQAEEILEMIGIPRATAIDMFYRQIILNKGIPFSLTIPKNVPILEDMNEKDFNLMMANGYSQALQGDSHSIDDVFDELEKDL